VTQIRGLRWWVVALISFGTIINYLSRNALGVLAPTLKDQMGISTQQYSYIVGAFQIGYTIMQPVCGLIVDLIGLRLGFALFAALWSIAGCLQGGATGWLSLAGARGLMGLTEAAAIPAGMKAVAEWFPDKEKSIAVGFFNVGTSFGALMAPPLVAAVTLTLGWRAAFVVTGAVGFFWAALWYAFYRPPGEHALLSSGERQQILSGQTHADRRASRRSVRELLATRRFWAIAVPRFFAEPAWQTFSFWIPLYLATERHMDLKQIAVFAWMPFLAADFGGVFGGYVAPFLMKTFGVTLVWSRIWGVLIGALMMIGPGSIGFVSSPYVAIALFSLGGFAHQTISVLVNTLSADLFDSREVGTVSGFAGMAAWTGGLGFSLLVGALADSVGYGPLFGLLGVFDLIGAAALIVLIGGERHAERYAAASGKGAIR
jgi:MFS transporter, ACS family, hexuronate transporter